MFYHLIVCSCHVTYAFQSESTLYSYLNVKELLVWSSHHVWRLTDSNGTRTHNHLVCEGTLNHLAKLASCSCFKMLGITLFLQCWKLFQYHGTNYQLHLLSVLTKTWNKRTRNQPKRTKTSQNNPKVQNDPKFQTWGILEFSKGFPFSNFKPKCPNLGIFGQKVLTF